MSASRHSFLWIGLGLLVGILLFASRPSVRALPEYMTRTGEACAACHVNPAGGGLLTARGSLWVAAGKPDQVPPLATEAPSDSSAIEGVDLYVKFGCSGCHGAAGEGASGPALNQGELPAERLSEVTRDGIGSMAGYRNDVLPDADLAALVRYVQAFARGDTGAAQDTAGLMGPAVAACGNDAVLADMSREACDGN